MVNIAKFGLPSLDRWPRPRRTLSATRHRYRSGPTWS